MRKIKIVLILVCLIFIAVFGRKFYAGAFNGIKEYTSLKQERSVVLGNLDTIKSQMSNNVVSLLEDNYLLTYDNLSNFLNSLQSINGVTIQSMSAKKMKRDSIVDIADITDITVISNYSDTVDCLEIDCTTDDIKSVLNWFTQNKLKFCTVSIYPVNNEIDFYLLILGGDNN